MKNVSGDSLFIPSAINLFGLMVGVGWVCGVRFGVWKPAMADGRNRGGVVRGIGDGGDRHQRDRARKLVEILVAAELVQAADCWLRGMPTAWDFFRYRDDAIAGLGLGGHQFVLFAVGLLCLCGRGGRV